MPGPSTTTAIPVAPARARWPRLLGGAIAVVLVFGAVLFASRRTPRVPEAVHQARCEALQAAGKHGDCIRAARDWMRDWPAASRPYDFETKAWLKFTATPADQAAEEARAVREPDVFSLTVAALAKHSAGQDEDALRLADQAVRLDPDDRHGYAMRAIAQSALKRFDAADVSLGRACALAGGDPSTYLWMAHHCVELGRSEEAARWAATGLEQPHFLLGLVQVRDAALRALGRARDALDELESRLARRPEDVELQAFVAESLAADGAVERLLKLTPRLSPAVQRDVPALIAGWMEFRRDLVNHPRRWLGTARAVAKDRPLTLAVEVLLAPLPEVSKAQQEAWLLAAEKGAPAAMLTLLARARFDSLYVRQDKANAIAERLAAMPYRRGMPAALMGETIRARDPGAAMRLFDRALSVEPMNVAVRASIARSHLASARPDLGLQVLSAIPKELQSALVHAELGHLYEARREPAPSVVHYEAALAAGYDEPNLAWRLVQEMTDVKASESDYLRASAQAAALESAAADSRHYRPMPFFLLPAKP